MKGAGRSGGRGKICIIVERDGLKYLASMISHLLPTKTINTSFPLSSLT